jgi:transcription initiation factor TFIID subunit 1
MADSEEDNDRELETEMNLAGFMFGNIDENGQLEDDILDSNAKQHLASLCQLGLSSFLHEIMSEDTNNGKNKDLESKKEQNNKQLIENGQASQIENDKDIDYLTKDPKALDFSDINELAEDCNEEVVGNLKI